MTSPRDTLARIAALPASGMLAPVVGAAKDLARTMEERDPMLDPRYVERLADLGEAVLRIARRANWDEIQFEPADIWDAIERCGFPEAVRP